MQGCDPCAPWKKSTRLQSRKVERIHSSSQFPSTALNDATVGSPIFRRVIAVRKKNECGMRPSLPLRGDGNSQFPRTFIAPTQSSVMSSFLLLVLKVLVDCVRLTLTNCVDFHISTKYSRIHSALGLQTLVILVHRARPPCFCIRRRSR